jgi:Rps23 Pro-64 3,4-dihydroxylase Tpa1-like proline 4-hydroxylase
MTTQRQTALPEEIFDYPSWSAKADGLMRQYAEADPYPHIVLRDLLVPGIIEQLERGVPSPDAPGWTHYEHFNERKQVLSKRQELPESFLRAFDELKSERFVALLSKLTGVEGLFADPEFAAGDGLSLCGRGGFLNLHTDFTVHPRHPTWRRRVNLILFLNRDWDEAWGGHTDVWDRDMQRLVTRAAPVANSCLIFNTDTSTWHGHPNPITCPENRARLTMAFWYFADEPNAVRVSTQYRPQPSDGWLKRVLIYADNLLVRSYYFAKRELGISDAIASRLLKFITRVFTKLGRR